FGWRGRFRVGLGATGGGCLVAGKYLHRRAIGRVPFPVKLSRHWLWLILLVPVALGLARLRFDVEVLNLLPADVPAVKGLLLYQQNFSNARELIITVRAGEPEVAENAARTIAGKLREATRLTSNVYW